MLDPYVVLAPVFLLPVVGLLRYLGCALFYDYSDYTDAVLNIDPESATLFPNQKQQFKAVDGSNTPVDAVWSGPNITPDHGSNTTYTAPEPFDPGHTTETITAEAGGLTASVTVTLKPPSVTVIPPSVTLLPGEDQQFKVDPDQPVTWEIDPPDLGDITPQGGKYTAGLYKIGSDTVKVKATNQANETGWATVTLIGNAAGFVPPPDTATTGNWKNIYGKEGWALAGVPFNLPDYLLDLDFSSLSVFTWEDPTQDPRGLQKPPTFDNFAAAWYDPNPLQTVFDLIFELTDFKTHIVAIYCVDWTDQGRAQTFEFFDDSQTPATLLDTQALSDFGKGQYLVWQLVGKVRMRVTKTAGPNFVISGIFFG